MEGNDEEGVRKGYRITSAMGKNGRQGDVEAKKGMVPYRLAHKLTFLAPSGHHRTTLSCYIFVTKAF